MVKKGPSRSLSITVDPAHRLLTDESDRVRGGRIVLDGGNGPSNTHNTGNTGGTGSQQRPPAVPPSPAPSASFSIRQQDGPIASGSTLGRPPAGRTLRPLALALGDPCSSSVSLSAGPDAPAASSTDVEQPAPRLGLPPAMAFDSASPITQPSSPSRPPLPSTTSFSQSLAARRRPSVVSLPPIPSIPAPSLPLTHRARNDSVTSLASVRGHKRAPSLTKPNNGGRAEEDGFSYLNSAASTSHSALSSISMPAPYQYGPIQVLPGIWLGCEDNARDWEALKRCNIGSVLNVAKEINGVFGEDDKTRTQDSSLAPSRVRSSASTPNLTKFSPQPSPRILSVHNASFHPADPSTGRPALHHLHLPWSHGQSDLVSNGFPQAMAFADESTKRGKGVLIHCQCGVSRSATLVIALVMRAAARPDATEELKKVGTTMHGAYEFVKDKSVCIGPNMSLIYQLLEYEKQLQPRPPQIYTSSHPNLSESDAASQSEQHSSPIEHDRYASEEDRIRSEEEEWARMRKQMEEEEEREREESFRAAGAGPLLKPLSSSPWAGTGSPTEGDPVSTLVVPWGSDGWNASSPSTRSRSQADEEEAMNLDRAMEERLLRRKGSVASVASNPTTNNNATVSGSSSTTSTSLPQPPGNGTTPSSLATWRSRFGQHGGAGKRVRAGSVESNFTGRSVSMVSVEEEDEGDVELLDEGAGRRRLLSTSTAGSGSGSVGSALRWKAAKQAAQAQGRRSRTISAEDVRSSSSASGSGSIAASEDTSEANADEEFPAPPLSANTTSTNNEPMTTTPITPLSLSKAAVVRGENDTESNVQIIVEEATPLANRLAMYDAGGGSPMNLDSPISPTYHRPSAKPSMTLPLNRLFADPPPPSASARKMTFNMGDLVPPPSASPFKMTFGAPRAPLPPPSASHLRMSFEQDDDPPAPSASATKTSFGSNELSIPFPTKSSNAAAAAAGAGDFKAQLAARRALKKAVQTLETVPSSPPAVGSATPPTSARLMDVLGSSKRRSSPSRSSIRSRSGKLKIGSFTGTRAPSPPALDMVNAAPEPTRKRTKSRPVPAPLALSKASDSSNSTATYVLSSSTSTSALGHRANKSSVSSASSSSSSSSVTRLRNKLLSRVTGGGSPTRNGPQSPSSMATPHQTLFIFPPSPNSRSTFETGGMLPSGTPSAMMLTTNYGYDPASAGARSSTIPMLSPTPTLSTFMSGERRRVARKASVSSSSSSSNGWLGGMPSTPTTACARVDARGWVGR